MSTVEIKNGEVWMQPNRLIRSLQTLNSRPVPIATGMKLRRISRLIDQQVSDVGAEYQKIIDLYAVKGDEGQPATDDNGALMFGESEGEATARFDELMALTFEVDAIKASEIEKMPDIATDVLIGLGDLLVDDLAPSENGASAKPPKKRR